MKIRTENDDEYILISGHADLEELTTRMIENEEFACQFKFSERELFTTLLESLKIDYDDFATKYYHYNASRKLHISESEFGYVWISTLGLVAKKEAARSPAINSCLNQYTVISLLLGKAFETVKDERVYDIDSYSFGLLGQLSPAIFHNLTFYVEVFCKAYLSLVGVQIPHTHKLSLIYSKTVQAMNSNNHDNSLLQVLIIDPLYKFVDHLSKIPIGFKEHFIKYDDNPMDDSVILFETESLAEIKTVLELSVDFITEYFYRGIETSYLETNLYQRLLDKADTEEKKKRIQNLYPHLAKV